MQDKSLYSIISDHLGISLKQVSATIKLIDEGATVPFISRYRKEATMGLDEVEIENIKNTTSKFRELEKRKLSILDTIKEQGKGNLYFRLMYILEEKAAEETVEYYVGYNVESECMEQRRIDENPCFFYINKYDNLVLKGEDGIDYEIVWDSGNLDFADTWPCANVYYEDNSHLEYIHLKPMLKPVGPL
jgi:hypothetical protein